MLERSKFKVTHQLGFKAQLILLLATLLVLMTLRTAQAEGTTVVTTTTTTTVNRSGPPDPTPTPTAPQDFIVTARFGPSATSPGLTGCKTEPLAKELVRDLKSDCSAWLKDRKSELNLGGNAGGRSRYLTGTCQEDCSDCGMGLQRCSVVGTVHYRP